MEQEITRKEQLKKVSGLNVGDNSEEYKVEAIWDSAVYAIESKSGHLPELYYLVAWKGYPEEENIWEPVLAVQHLNKLISLFHKHYLKKPTPTSPPVDSAPPIAKPKVKPMAKSITKWKRGQPAINTNKQAKKN